MWPVTCRAFRVKRSVFIACVSASLQHSWGPTDNTWVAKTGRLGQRRIHGLRVFKSTVGYCMICNALKPGNSCCSSQRSANDILSMIRLLSSPNNQVLQSQSVASYCLTTLLVLGEFGHLFDIVYTFLVKAEENDFCQKLRNICRSILARHLMRWWSEALGTKRHQTRICT